MEATMALPCTRWASAQSPSPPQHRQLHSSGSHTQAPQHRVHLSPAASSSPLPLSAGSSLWGTPLVSRGPVSPSNPSSLAPCPSASASPSSHGPCPTLAPKPKSRKRSPPASSASSSKIDTQSSASPLPTASPSPSLAPTNGTPSTAAAAATTSADSATSATQLLSAEDLSLGGPEEVFPKEKTLTITIVGASGDLARKKIFPALFALFYEGCLPKNFQVFGYARSKMDDDQLRNVISSTLTCRIDKREECGHKMDEFLSRVFYQSGQYSSVDGFKALAKRLETLEAGKVANRLFYLSIPPNVFLEVARCANLGASSPSGFTRIIVEKPFGRDSQSSAELTRGLAQYWDEEQIYRIDHYLGKELVENLLVLRFSNLVFEPLWSRQYIRNVQLIFSEDFGTDGRGGYFDNYGIIRDIMQNHLLQILTLFAMEPPVGLSANDIINEKVKVLRSMKPLRVEDTVVAQYKGHTSRSGTTYPGYTDDPTVPANSITPTFAAAAMFIDNARWDGVPFLMKAGKALHTRRAEIRVQFRHVPGNLYKSRFGTDLDQATNELVIRLQPDEAIYLKINNKVPGLGFRLDRSTLNLQYFDMYKKELPDAYERLLLDAIDGDKRLFIRADELEHAWALFTPLLDELEQRQVSPELYPYASRGPIGAHYLAAKYGVRWGDQSV